MNSGAFGENFPYSNFHDLNMDWIIKIAKDFLDQYTHIQQIIADGETSLTELTEDGLAQLQTKADNLEQLLQAWYNEHSQDIADQLTDALNDLNEWYTVHQNYLDTTLATNIAAFNTSAEQKAAETIASIPSDYTDFFNMALKTNTLLNGTNNTFDCNTLGDNTVQLFNAVATIINGPSNFSELQTGTWMIMTIKTTFHGQPFKYQLIRNLYDMASKYAIREKIEFVSNEWSAWSIRENIAEPIKELQSEAIKTNPLLNGNNRTFDCNTLGDNTVQIFNSNATISNAPTDFPELSRDMWYIVTLVTDFLGQPYKFQIIKNLYDDYSRYAVREKREAISSDWSSWIIKSPTHSIIHVGQGQTYTRLRDGISAAVAIGNTTVYVHPGTYNLLTEFATEIESASSQSDVGLELGNNIHVIFYDGAKVRALFDNSQGQYTNEQWLWIKERFCPLHTMEQDDNNYIVENIDIVASNCRYIVHDELWGRYNGIHKYINCKMKHTYTREGNTFPQCIGGGLGSNTTIVIDGGYYESVYNSADNKTLSISYHNGNQNDVESSIMIKNVVTTDDGYFRFGYYGPSQKKTKVFVTNCKMGYPVLKSPETPGSTVDNFDIISWNNDIANN